MVKKKVTKKKKTKANGIKKGTKLVCHRCGLVVTVNRACGCVGVCDLICCGSKLRAKK